MLVCAPILAACGNNASSDEENVKSEPVDVIFARAQESFSKHAYTDAVKDYEEVERQYPFSPLATRSQIMAAYAQYNAEKYDEAIIILQRFVKLHPNSDSTPYAYYLTALCYYDRIVDVGREQKVTEDALQALREVVRRFPDSDYARDAKIKIDLVVDHLAGKEMAIGRYYLKRQEFLAAINRFRTVVEQFQTTTHVPEALHRLVEAYLRLGVPQEAKRYAAVLGHNYPSSVWYRDSYRLITGKSAAAKAGSGGKNLPPIPQAPDPQAPEAAPDDILDWMIP